MRRLFALLLVFLTLLAPAPLAGEPVQAVHLAIILHPARTEALRIEDIASIYLKKRRFWKDGEPIVPLNQAPGTGARESFSRRVFGEESERLGTYWNEQYFHGIFPPIRFSSSAAIKRYVAADRNAIGYIELSEVDDSIRVALQLK